MKAMRHLRPFRRLTLPLAFFSAAAFAQYKAEPAGAPPSDLAPAIAKALQNNGTKITNNGTPYLEIWFRADKPSGAKSTEEAVTLPNIPQGALLAVIRLDGKGSDRRGQAIKPGVYTLRYSVMPVNGDHQGAAPQRDFVLMVPAADDKDPSATPSFEALVEMSKKASGTGHPAVMSLWKADDGKTGLSQQGDDWVIQTKLGDTPIALIVIGTAAA
jgi:hypothetical protein